MKYIKLFEEFVNEYTMTPVSIEVPGHFKTPLKIKVPSVLRDPIVDQLESIIKKTSKMDKNGFYIVNNDDFTLKYDIIAGSHIFLDWVNTKTNKYKGLDIFRALLKMAYTRELNVLAFGVKGKHYGVDAFGYYALLRWGFVPEDGIKTINKLLKTDYKTIEDAYSDPMFWKNWKANGTDIDIMFDVKDNSFSFKKLEEFINKDKTKASLN